MDLPMEAVETHTTAADGASLAATRFSPLHDNGTIVLVAAATGVRRGYYGPFARYLSSRGFNVLTWDWRGIGESRSSALDASVTMRNWAELDLRAAIDLASARAGRVVVVGHSFGGQALGLAPNAPAIARAVTIGSQHGYWGHWPPSLRYLYAVLWYGGVPLVTRLLGWFPLGLSASAGTLPPGVALEWARWNRNPDFIGDWTGHERFRAPILSWSFSDDTYAPKAPVDALHARFGGPVTRRHLTPAEAGARRVGHWGFFREGLVPRLWEESAAWLGEGAR
jgi:predicted alpha/beta hydrolase